MRGDIGTRKAREDAKGAKGSAGREGGGGFVCRRRWREFSSFLTMIGSSTHSIFSWMR